MIRFSPEARVLLALAAVLVAGCDRPLVDPIAPAIEVISPDLTTVQGASTIRLQLSITALSDVDEVLVDGAQATRDAETGLWEISVALRPGANTLVLEASSESATTTREIDIVQASIGVRGSDGDLPQPRADHTATRLDTGVLLAGGIDAAGDVIGSAQLLRERAGTTFTLDAPLALQTPRTGHTATALPDGRVLLLGGTSSPEASGESAFVSVPEILDPETGTTRAVFTRRSPSRKTGHTTILLTRDGRTYLYVLGGVFPLPGSVALSSTVDVLELRSSATADTLVTLTPPGGAGNGFVAPDGTQLVVATSANQVVTIWTGLDTISPDRDAFASRLFYTAPGSQYPFDLTSDDVEAPVQPRTSAAGTQLSNSLALLVGGRDPDGAPLASLEVFSDRLGRFLSVPAELTTPRYGHTVTLAPSGRILVIGGRDASGQALSSVEVLTL